MNEKLLKYKIIADFAALLGLGASLFFIIAINEPQLTQNTKERQISLKRIL